MPESSCGYTRSPVLPRYKGFYYEKSVSLLNHCIHMHWDVKKIFQNAPVTVTEAFCTLGFRGKIANEVAVFS